MPRLLGDVYPAATGDGILDNDDVNTYDDALTLNVAHSERGLTPDPQNPGEQITRIIDINNGGFIPEQSSVASLHKTGFISNIDKMLLNMFITDPQGENLQAHINALDSKEIIPVPDPTDTKTLDQLRSDIVANIQTLVIYQAQVFLDLQHTLPSSLHDVEQKMARVWADAYAYEYDVAAQTDANMTTALETDGGQYAEDDGHKQLPQNMYNNIKNIIAGEDPLSKSQLDQIVTEYWKAGAITISDPPTAEEQTAVIDHIWNETGVEKGLSFYNTWKDVEPTPGPDPTPSTDLIRPIPETAPTIDYERDELGQWIENSENKTDFKTAIANQHPYQIITCAFQDGVTNESEIKAVTLVCWQYSSGSWSRVATYDTGSYVGGGIKDGEPFGGIYPVSELSEGNSERSCRTPAGAFQLGNYTTNPDDIGAFGIPTSWGEGQSPSDHGINYRAMTANNVHWVDKDGMNGGLTNWYNMFANCDGQKVLIQYERFDWNSGSGVNIVDKDGNSYNTKNVEFKYGQYYVPSLNNSNDYHENLYDFTTNGSRGTGAYNHAVVIRFNMPPHVTRPVLPKNDDSESIYHSDGIGAGSAYFLHSSTGGNTYGCVSTPDDKMQDILKWLNLADNPHIFIRLPS